MNSILPNGTIIYSIHNNLLASGSMDHKLLLIYIGSYIEARLLSINNNLISYCTPLMLSHICRMLFPFFLFYYYLFIQYITHISIIFFLVCRSSHILIKCLILYSPIILISNLIWINDTCICIIFCILAIICI